jgi:hypothetical protein
VRAHFIVTIHVRQQYVTEKGSRAKAINRLIGGEVPAAVLTLVSPEAAEAFPEIAGFKIFRIPLSPRSLKTRL